MKTQKVFGAFIILAMVLGACATATPEPTAAPTEVPVEPTAIPAPTEMPDPEPMDIVDTAVADGRFETLVAAVQAADLVDALKGDGPLTVFAPTDDAFAALPEGTVEALLGDIPTLTDILLYHVVDGKVMAADVVELNQAQTLQGQFIDIRLEDGKVFIDNAEVLITDIETSNGVIHVIDAVILPESRDIVDIAVEDGRFETLVAAVGAAGLVDALKGDGPLTVFAPTDDAFAALPEGTVEALLNDIPALTDILLYHVFEGKFMASDVLGMKNAMSLQGQYAEFSLDMDKAMIDNAQIILTDIEASNGVIHVIDAVILPETRDIVDIAVEDGRFTALVEAVQAAGLVDALKGEGPLTVFAPTDDAFAALPEGTLAALHSDVSALSNILLYHVAAGKFMAADVLASDSLLSLQGQYVNFSLDMDKVMIDNAQIILTDIEASNGVIHVIDAVILPETRDIVDIAVEDGRFQTLVAAVQAAGLVDALKADGPLTVFAPTDDAFAALPEGTVEALLEDIPTLTNILLYHVVDGKVMAADVVELSEAETLLGENVSIMVEDGKVMINESQVIITDIEASNGVIHVIDAVLLPPAE
jgi:transforming growth factor-beta-induced protein